MQDALERWRSEKTASYLSSAVAAAERDPAKAALFREMAEAAETQAGILAKELKPVPVFEPSLRSRLTVSLIGLFGPRAVRHVLSASKVRGVSVYRGKLQPEGHPWPTSAEEVGRRHKTHGGGTLRARRSTRSPEELGLNPNVSARQAARPSRPSWPSRSARAFPSFRFCWA